MFEPEVFRKQMHCIEESTCDIVATFRRPYSHLAPLAMIWRPCSGSVLGNCAPLPPLVTPLPPTATVKLEKWGAMPAFHRLTFMCY